MISFLKRNLDYFIVGLIFSSIIYDQLLNFEEVFISFETTSLLLVLGFIFLLERLKPLDPSIKRPELLDFTYSLLSNRGFIFLAAAFTLEPLMNWFEAVGIPHFNLSELLEENSVPIFCSFVIQAFFLDFFDYWRHRFEHRFAWWWAFHKSHHDVEKMTFLSLDRNHVVASILNTLEYSLVATFLGVYPSQFVQFALVITFIDYFSHANVDISFGRIFEKFIVSPKYHRIHHSKELFKEAKDYSYNFANVFPVIDMMFGTAKFSVADYKTGINEDTSKFQKNILLHHYYGFREFFKYVYGKLGLGPFKVWSNAYRKTPS